MSDGFVPPQSVRNNARRGLELRRKFNRGGTEVGVARARDLSNGKALSRETIGRMVSYFARHEVDKKGKDWGNASNPSAGYIAWLLWGGDAGRSWANSIYRKEKTVQTTIFTPIIKSEKQDDGSLLVTGIATDSTLDIDEQVCDNDWLKSAMPAWFKWGNIREQHSSIAAGVATEYEEQDGKHFITARIVDKSSVKKIEAGVLKGFSVGIRNPRVVRDEKAAGGRIVDGEIVEVSVVDRPANPACVLTLAKTAGADLVQVEELIEKREFSQEERDTGAEEGWAMPDGSYPIKTREDLRNAIQAFGRAKNPAATKKHIIRRARALNAEDLLPEGWVGAKAADSQLLEDVMSDVVKEAHSEEEETHSEACDCCDSCESGCDGSCCKECKAMLDKSVNPEETEVVSDEVVAEVSAENVAEDVAETVAEDVAKAAKKAAKKAYKKALNKALKSVSPEESDTIPAEEADEVIEPALDEVLAKFSKRLRRIEKSINSLVDAFESTTTVPSEAIAKSVAEVTERVAQVEKSASRGPARLAPQTTKSVVNENMVKAAEYRAKAASTTDRTLREGYELLATELENN